MSVLKVDYTNVLNFVSKEKINEYQEDALLALNKLVTKTGAGNDYVGWVDWPVLISPGEIEDIRETAEIIKEQSECLLVIGIGGSYLGARAVISMLEDYYPTKKGLEIIFFFFSITTTYTVELLEYLRHRDFSINVVSKSGTTTEPAIAFRLAKELLEEKYGNEANKRIFVTTSEENSVLHNIAKTSGYKEFFIPKDIGGRYSVLTAVGLLPIACAGYDIYEILKGAMDARQTYSNTLFWENYALIYATIRNILYQGGKHIELLVSHEPKLKYFAEWWKQLYGESEGKDHKGLFPASAVYSTDLHSLGQYVQDGQRKLFETVINIVNPEKNIVLNRDNNNYDGLNFIAGKSLDYIAKKAMEGTIQAHVEGDVPNIIINFNKIDQYDIGFLFYFFMFACGISGYLLGVNPFNQEGVEAYKKKMFELLGKPGY